MPHRTVVKESRVTTNFGLGCDASALGFNGVSLNSYLETEPSRISDLTRILVRFKCCKIALCADVTQTFCRC